MNNLGDAFDYAVYDCKYELEDFFSFFLVSGVAEAFGKGNPKYIAGLSGPEITKEVLLKTKGSRPDAAISENIDKSAEYWSGWILAYYQWYTGRSFADLYKDGVTMEHLLNLYPTLHEADITKFVDMTNRFIEQNAANNVTNLQKIRKAAGLTQQCDHPNRSSRVISRLYHSEVALFRDSVSGDHSSMQGPSGIGFR